MQLLGVLFEEEIQNAILSIPLSPEEELDRLIWHFTKKGEYTVSSAYKLARSLTLELNHEQNTMWKILWQLKVPPRVKFFLWRAAHNCLPTRANLLAKRVNVGAVCGVCETEFENSWHVFVACSFADEVWQATPFHHDFCRCRDNSEGFIEFLSKLLVLRDDAINVKGAMIIWQIWRDRNEAVWNERKPHPAVSISMFVAAHREWMDLQGPQTGVAPNVRPRQKCWGWHDLQPGWMRCGVDAAFFAGTNTTGIGIILQNDKGVFVEARVVTLSGCFRVDEGEAMGLHEALSWIKQKNLARVEFTSDSKVVVDAIGNRDKDSSEFGAIIDSCRLLLRSSFNFRVKFVRREANVVAHKLAKMSKNFSSTHVWVEPPSDVEDLLIGPCVC